MNEKHEVLQEDYRHWFLRISDDIRKSQIKAAVRVNQELLMLYWRLGGEIVEMQKKAKWGDKFLETFSHDLLNEFPSMKGFSFRNLSTIRQWYLFYNTDGGIEKQVVSESGGAIMKQVVSQLCESFFSVPWGHHIYIIQRCKTKDEAFFFIRKTVQNNWSRSILLNFLDTDLYERQGNAITNFKETLPSPKSDLAQEMTRDPYCFDFTGLRENYNERQLKEALINNIEKFLLELGTGFAYMGREYRLEVGNTEQFLDMLFYNVYLKCYIVIEVKTQEFEPSFIGQLGTYVVAVNHILKKADDNKTIGLLICKTKDAVVAKYAMESSKEPIGISEYELSKLYPAEIKGTIPSVEEIEENLTSCILSTGSSSDKNGQSPK